MLTDSVAQELAWGPKGWQAEMRPQLGHSGGLVSSANSLSYRAEQGQASPHDPASRRVPRPSLKTMPLGGSPEKLRHTP